MNDVIDRLGRLAPGSTPAMDAQADLARGRIARSRRRTRRAGLAVGGLALAVAATYGVVSTGEEPGDTRIQLVAYTGEQLPGFTVDKVPEGFVLQGASAHVLAVAKPGDTSTIDDFAEKLVVMLEADQAPAVDDPRGGEGKVFVQKDGTWLVVLEDGTKVIRRPKVGEEPRDLADGLQRLDDVTPASEPVPTGTPVTVNGTAGTIVRNSEGTKTLKYDHGEFQVVIQMWPTLGLSDAQLVEFAEGVAVTSEAKPSVG